MGGYDDSSALSLFPMLKYKLAMLRHRTFPDPRISQSLTLLDHCDDLFSDELLWPEVKCRVAGSLIQIGRKGRRILADEAKATRMIFEVIATYATQQIAHGNLHIYRGTLSLRGQSYRSIAETAISWLHEYDWYDYEEYHQKLDDLDELVRSVG